MDKTIVQLQDTKEVGLTYQALEITTENLMLTKYATFANEKLMTSQLGFFLLMMDGTVRANVIHYWSIRCKRVTQSIMASEIHTLVLGYDYAYKIQHLAEEFMGRNLQLHGYTGIRTVLNKISKYRRTTETRL